MNDRYFTLFGFAPLFIAVVLVAALNSCGGDAPPERQSEPTAVRVMVVELSDEQVTKTYTGTLEGEQQAVMYARVAEAVDAVHVREGERVSAGRLLISLNKGGPGSRYLEAQAIFRNAEKQYRKMERLFNEGAVSETEFDAARTEYEVARASFEAAAELVEIRSPIDGVVTAVDVSAGDYLTLGQGLVTVAATDRLR
ncbi:MAG: efflux RND transporter periplasmic adaptor subunit, partial [Candidatus Zixiibacteriota bacterium]